MTLNKILVLLLFSVLLSACGGGTDSNSPSPTADTTTDSDSETPQVISQGNRILGMDVKEVPSSTYALAYDQALSMGVREVSVSLNWAVLEPSLGNYDTGLPGVINSYYSSKAADLTLVLRPLDTPGPSLPVELVGKAFNDPAVIQAFSAFLTNLHSQLPSLNASGKLKWIHVGNEVDAYLGSDATRWSQWNEFFDAAKLKIESLWGESVIVSSIVQFGSLENNDIYPHYSTFLEKLDSAVLTYYPLQSDFTFKPLSAISNDFQIIVDKTLSKSIILQECGYASSEVNNSSEAQQADFISTVFTAWDSHHTRISLIDFTWQYDISEATADQWVIDYGMASQPNNNEFKYYLWSLGLSHYDSTEKPALQRLRDELQSRSWIN